MGIIKARNVKYDYIKYDDSGQPSESYRAVDDVNLDISKGQFISILGHNGSGKSTVLKIITGVLQPTMGNVTVNGRISALLELGAGFNMEYTGVENVYLNGTMLGFTEEEINKRLPEILRFADIGDFVNQPVKTYSSGMFVRLAFAVAINIDPEILIVDEALSFVSHDLSSISKYCDRVVLLNQGVKVDEGSPKAMVDLYKRFLVHQEGEPEKHIAREGEWRSKIQVNPNILEYGEKLAEIVDFAVVDKDGKLTNTIEKGTTCTFKMKIEFHKDLQEPIVAFTIKDMKGTEITGTNTMYEKIEVPAKKDTVVEVAFTQKMDLQGGSYLISFGCTGYMEGDFHVFHRLYDACSVNVVSMKDTVGFYDMNSRIEVQVTK